MNYLKNLPILILLFSASNWAFSTAGDTLGFIVEDDLPIAHSDSRSLLKLEAESFDPLTTRLSPPEILRDGAGVVQDGPLYFIVQFHRRIVEEVKGEITESGAQVLGYLPENALLIRGYRDAIRRVGRIDSVRWLGPWIPYFKLSSGLREELLSRGEDNPIGTYVAVLFPGIEPDQALGEFDPHDVEIIQVVDMSEVIGERESSWNRVVFRSGARDLFEIAKIRSVSWIEPLLIPEMRNDRAQWVIQTNVSSDRSIWQHRLFGVGQVIGHIDGRLDRNSCYFKDDEHPIGPDHRKIVAYRSSTGYGSDSHGTHTAGTAAGEAAFGGGDWTYDGMAPGAKISHSNLGDVNNANLAEYLIRAYRDGAKIHTNSWGDDWTTGYTQWCRDIDQVSHDYEENLVCFAVTNMNSLRTPENAKNVLAVGATSAAPDQDLHCSGGMGPTADGRRKPEIYAPGCDTRSARAAAGCATWTMSGTSMASPAVAGAGALVREYFEEGWYPSGIRDEGNRFAPSGSLVKAVLLNSAVDMVGVSGYPSDREGWGRVLLENGLYFSGDPRGLIVRDVRMIDGLSTGNREIIFFDVTGRDEDLKVTLVWHDYPAAVGASFAPVNDLDLYVRSPGGTMYRGNVFSGGRSVPGGGSDTLNNVEQVHIPSPGIGKWGLMVRGREVNMGPQGYALVITGEVIQDLAPD